MTKQKNLELEARTYTPFAEWSFYRPHDRLKTAFTNEWIHPVTGEITHPPSRTKQEFKDECDINNIIKAYKITGQIAHISANAAKGVYMDLPEPTDYQESLNIIRQAEQSFDSLPAKIRDRFKNDPTQFLDFLKDPKNRDEAMDLGLIDRPPIPVAPAAPPVAPAAPPPAPPEPAK